MAKQLLIVTEDQVLVDKKVIFNAIREANGDWEKVEQELDSYLSTVRNMAGGNQESQA